MKVCTYACFQKHPHIQLAFLYSAPCLVNCFHFCLIQPTLQMLNPHIGCSYWQKTSPANLNTEDMDDIGRFLRSLC